MQFRYIIRNTLNYLLEYFSVLVQYSNTNAAKYSPSIADLYYKSVTLRQCLQTKEINIARNFFFAVITKFIAAKKWTGSGNSKFKHGRLASYLLQPNSA